MKATVLSSHQAYVQSAARITVILEHVLACITISIQPKTATIPAIVAYHTRRPRLA